MFLCRKRLIKPAFPRRLYVWRDEHSIVIVLAAVSVFAVVWNKSIGLQHFRHFGNHLSTRLLSSTRNPRNCLCWQDGWCCNKFRKHSLCDCQPSCLALCSRKNSQHLYFLGRHWLLVSRFFAREALGDCRFLRPCAALATSWEGELHLVNNRFLTTCFVPVGRRYLFLQHYRHKEYSLYGARTNQRVRMLTNCPNLRQRPDKQRGNFFQGLAAALEDKYGVFRIGVC